MSAFYPDGYEETGRLLYDQYIADIAALRARLEAANSDQEREMLKKQLANRKSTYCEDLKRLAQSLF